MKVLHVTNAFPYDDYESFGIFIKEQVDSLASIGITNEVIFINARTNGVMEYLRVRSLILEKLISFEPDIIHLHHEFSMIPLSTIRTDKPIILSLLGDLKNRGLINKMIFKLFKRKAKRIILKTNPDVYGNYIYLPNGVDTNLFKPLDKAQCKRTLGLDDSKKYILFVSASKMNPIKRYDKFSKVISNLKVSGFNVEELILTGITRKQTPLYFNASDLLLLTSDHEGSPNAVKEAMACNLQIVSTNVGNVPYLLDETSDGLICSEGSVEELTKLCSQLLSNRSESLRNRELIFSKELDIKSVADKLRELYLSVEI